MHRWLFSILGSRRFELFFASTVLILFAWSAIERIDWMTQVRRPYEHPLPEHREPTGEEQQLYSQEMRERIHAADGSRFRADAALWSGLAALFGGVGFVLVFGPHRKRSN
jgi:hypothetical protein